MNHLILVALFAAFVVISIFLFPVGPVAVLFCAAGSAIAVFFIKKVETNRRFHLNLFFLALLVRVTLATIIYALDLQLFFGPDANEYDKRGFELMQYLTGTPGVDENILTITGNTSMHYVVATIYMVLGRNPLCIQYLNALAGAATVPVIYLCAHYILGNHRVARTAAVLVAFFPSMIVWTSQALKDGLIIFLLALTIMITLKLQKEFNFYYVIGLIFGLISVFSLRYYIFFMLSAAILSSLIIGAEASVGKIIQKAFIIIVIATGFTYLGIIQEAQDILEQSSLEQMQAVRQGMGTEAESSYGQDIDVTTTEGLLVAVPLGIAYLLFAPFPWDINNFRQLTTFPEMVVWWSSMPFLVYGLWFILKNHLRQSMVILIFAFTLTLTYALFQGNVGTAYRHRAQIMVFHFIFIAVGLVLAKDHLDDRNLVNPSKRYIK